MPGIDLSPPSPLLPYAPETHGLRVERALTIGDTGPDRAYLIPRTNIPQELWLWDAVGYSWGDLSPGTYTLALNVLDRFIGWRPATVCDHWHFPLACDSLVYHWAPAFVYDILRFVPRGDGCVPAKTIRQWIGTASWLWSDGAGGWRGPSLRELFPHRTLS